MHAYYDLLLQLTHIINAIVLSRGEQNDQTLAQARHFLQEYRTSIMSVFKRNARIGGLASVEGGSPEDGGAKKGEKNNQEILADLVDQFTVLIAASGFLESDGEGGKLVNNVAMGTRVFT